MKIETHVTGGEWKQNCYLLHDRASGDMMIIDPGDEALRLAEEIRRAGGRLVAILLTHAHHDHVGAVADLVDMFQVPVFVHPGDGRLLRQAPTYARVFGGRAQRPVTGARELGVDIDLRIGLHCVSIIEAPGHSPGSVCYLLGNALFGGDLLLGNDVGRTDLPGSDVAILVRSVERVLTQFPADTVVYPGHGPVFTIGAFAGRWPAVRARVEARPQRRSMTRTDEDRDSPPKATSS